MRDRACRQHERVRAGGVEGDAVALGEQVEDVEGVAGDEALNQRDGIHPTAAGARIVADNVWAVLKPIAEARRQPTT